MTVCASTPHSYVIGSVFPGGVSACTDPSLILC